MNSANFRHWDEWLMFSDFSTQMVWRPVTFDIYNNMTAWSGGTHKLTNFPSTIEASNSTYIVSGGKRSYVLCAFAYTTDTSNVI